MIRSLKGLVDRNVLKNEPKDERIEQRNKIKVKLIKEIKQTAIKNQFKSKRQLQKRFQNENTI